MNFQILNSLQFVRGYYQIAASRFADNICLGIQSRLFAKCGREMEDAVTQHLGTGEDTGAIFSAPCQLLRTDHV